MNSGEQRRNQCGAEGFWLPGKGVMRHSWRPRPAPCLRAIPFQQHGTFVFMCSPFHRSFPQTERNFLATPYPAGSGAGPDLSASWTMAAAPVLPRGHLPVTSQTCNHRVMESSQAAIETSWGRVGADAAARTVPLRHSLLAVPRKKAAGNELRDGHVVPSTCCPWGKQLLPTACHHCVPEPFSSSDNGIGFCPLPLCTYTDCTTWSEFYSAGLELRRQISFLSLIGEHTLGTAATPRASEVPGCLPPTELGRMESLHHIMERQMSVFLIYRAILEAKTFLAHRDKDDGNHSKITCMRENRAGESLFGYLRQRNIFKCFGLWLGISRKRFKQIFVPKVLSENTWSLIFVFFE